METKEYSPNVQDERACCANGYLPSTEKREGICGTKMNGADGIRTHYLLTASQSVSPIRQNPLDNTVLQYRHKLTQGGRDENAGGGW